MYCYCLLYTSKDSKALSFVKVLSLLLLTTTVSGSNTLKRNCTIYNLINLWLHLLSSAFLSFYAGSQLQQISFASCSIPQITLFCCAMPPADVAHISFASCILLQESTFYFSRLSHFHPTMYMRCKLSLIHI